jgi:DNA-binding transcriptional MocR family regulator
MTPQTPARTATLQSAQLQRLQEQIAALVARGEAVHALMQGESDAPTPEHIVEAGMQALREGHTRYPPGRGYLELRRQIALKLRHENYLHVDPDTQVFVTSGGFVVADSRTRSLHGVLVYPQLRIVASCGPVLIKRPPHLELDLGIPENFRISFPI